jgi:hypothetical protein
MKTIYLTSLISILICSPIGLIEIKEDGSTDILGVNGFYKDIKNKGI